MTWWYMDRQCLILAFLNLRPECECLLTQLLSVTSLNAFLCLTFWFFFFPPLLGLLSHLVWPLFQVTSETPLDPKLRKVSVSPRHRLTSAQAACHGQRESVFLFSYFRAHATAFCNSGADVPENTRCLRFLIGGAVGLEGKKRVEEYKSLFFTL